MNRKRLSIVLLLSAVVLFAAPFALWPTYGETPYYVDRSPTNEAVAAEDVVTYDELPPVAQESFDNPVPNHTHAMWSKQDREAIALYEDHRYVRKDGQVYEVTLEHHDGVWVFVTILRSVMFLVAALLAIAGVVLYARGRRGDGTGSDPGLESESG